MAHKIKFLNRSNWDLSRIMRTVAIVCVFLGFSLAIWYLIDGGFVHFTSRWDPESMPKILPFMSSFVAPLFSLAGILFLFVNLWQARVSQFENNFFRLLDNHHKIVQNIKGEIPGLTEMTSLSEKTEFFDDLAFRIAIDYMGVPVATKDPLLEEAGTQKEEHEKQTYTIVPDCLHISYSAGKERLLYVYGYYFHVYQSSLGHYFRNLYHIINYVDNANISGPKNYVEILRAQLSNYELLLVAYHGMYQDGIENFKSLLEKYEFLKNLNFEIGLSLDSFKELFPIMEF